MHTAHTDSPNTLLSLPRELFGVLYQKLDDPASRRSFYQSCKSVHEEPSVIAQLGTLRLSCDDIYDCLKNRKENPVLTFPKAATLKRFIVFGGSSDNKEGFFLKVVQPEDERVRSQVQQRIHTLEHVELVDADGCMKVPLGGRQVLIKSDTAALGLMVRTLPHLHTLRVVNKGSVSVGEECASALLETLCSGRRPPIDPIEIMKSGEPPPLDWATLEGCPQLKELHVSPIATNDIPLCASLRNLESLTLEGVPMPYILEEQRMGTPDLLSLRTLTRLRHFCLSKIIDMELPGLEDMLRCMPHVESLQLQGPNMCADWGVLGQLPQLKRLHFGRVSVKRLRDFLGGFSPSLGGLRELCMDELVWCCADDGNTEMAGEHTPRDLALATVHKLKALPQLELRVNSLYLLGAGGVGVPGVREYLAHLPSVARSLRVIDRHVRRGANERLSAADVESFRGICPCLQPLNQ